MREKDLGIWLEYSWGRMLDEVRALACGLAAKGLQRGDKVAIVGDNRPQLYWAMVAAQCVGGVPVPLYQDAVAEEMQFVLEHAETRFAIVEDQEQVDKLLLVKERCPRLELIVYDDPRGLRHYSEPFLFGFEAIQAAGREFDAQQPTFFEAQVALGKGDDLAVILYTSGTTGRPKGVMLSYDNIVITSRNALEREGLGENEEILSYLPMAWVGDHIFSYGQFYCGGFCVSCPEIERHGAAPTCASMGPTYFFAPPRMFENILTTVMIRMEDAGLPQAKSDVPLLPEGRASASARASSPTASRSIPWSDALLYAPRPPAGLRAAASNTLGFSRIRLAYTAGEAIGPDIFHLLPFASAST